MDSIQSKATATAAAATVQHVTKKSSDELLRKFAQLGDEGKACRKQLQLVKVSKRRKRSRTTPRETDFCESPLNSLNGGASLVERKWLLPPAASKRSALLRQLGIGRSTQLRARDVKKKSLAGTFEKTWRRTVEGASRVFMEKQYNRHRRLINDVV